MHTFTHLLFKGTFVTYQYKESSLIEMESIFIDDAGLILSLGWDNTANSVDSHVRYTILLFLAHSLIDLFTRLILVYQPRMVQSASIICVHRGYS